MILTSLEIVLKWSFLLVTLTFILGCERESNQADQDKAKVATSSDGISIAYEVYGERGPALVFVHGWSCDQSYWQEQVEPFSHDYRVITVDLGGHGKSGLGRTDWTIQAFGGDVAAVVKENSLEEVILIGHSMGGDVIIEAARQLPGRVKGLVWLDTYRQLGIPRTPEQVQEFLAPFRANFKETTLGFVRGMFSDMAGDSLIERIATDMAAAPQTVALSALESSFSYGRTVTQPLQELEPPVIAINPEDPATDIESMKRYGVEVILMPGVGHFLMLEDPDNFNLLLSKAIDKFVK